MFNKLVMRKINALKTVKFTDRICNEVLTKIKCELIGNAQSAIKLYRKFLGRLSLPDFLIIGAQECGTTALYSYLMQHPGVVKAKVKEINYFGNPNSYVKGKRWYASHFCTVSYKKRLKTKLGYMPMSVEASPNMHMPFYPKAVHEPLTSVKSIALFRDPADRAFPQYHHNRRVSFNLGKKK